MRNAETEITRERHLYPPRAAERLDGSRPGTAGSAE